jgi:hypothetical protein
VAVARDVAAAGGAVPALRDALRHARAARMTCWNRPPGDGRLRCPVGPDGRGPHAGRPTAGPGLTGGDRRAVPAPSDPALLVPPSAPASAVVALLVTAVLGRLVWHSTEIPALDAWVLREFGAHSGGQFRLATDMAAGLRAFTICGTAATLPSCHGRHGDASMASSCR